MRLPPELQEAIENEVSDVAGIPRAANELSDAYRKGELAVAPLRTTAHRLAYLRVRMPATYAACRHVLEKTQEQIPEFQPRSLLDLGAGPGTAAWAAVAVYPTLERIQLVERDVELARLGKSLASQSADRAFTFAEWSTTDLIRFTLEPHDLVILSYSLGELNAPDAQRVIERAWNSAQCLIVIEPGTPKAFSRMAEWRKELIAVGATIAAPCPHERECPLLARGDWCHFSQRLERTAEHRRIKGGALGYEDEKFSYLAATRFEAPSRVGRIVRHPQIHTGYVQLQVCACDNLKQVTVTKSQKEIYRAARKAEWGNRWPS